jgi:vacuolar-type H+-ATPase subunit D/Vma8
MSSRMSRFDPVIKRLVSISTWHNLLENKRETLFNEYEQLKKVWRHAEKKYKSAGTYAIAVIFHLFLMRFKKERRKKK